MKTYFTQLLKLFFPDRCAACGAELPDDHQFLCTRCQWEIPLTGYWNTHQNPLLKRFRTVVPVEQACSLFFFQAENRYGQMIHRLKYNHQWRIGHELGQWLGVRMHESGLYDDMDMVIPVPLHWRRRVRRGYNQAEQIAAGIAPELGCTVQRSVIRRHRYNPSQTSLAVKTDRWKNVEGIFSVIRPEVLRGKHVLLVDDVLTTGATIASCARAIRDVVPDCRISIATLSVSTHELFGPGRSPL